MQSLPKDTNTGATAGSQIMSQTLFLLLDSQRITNHFNIWKLFKTMPQGCSQVAWCPGVHPESLDGCFRRWKITQCFCCLWELIKRLKLKLWGLGVRPASEERLWDLVLTGWRAAEPETCRDVHWSSFGRIGEHLTWRRVCGKSRKKHPEFYFSHRGQWKRNPNGYRKWRCLFCFVRQGKHITFTVFFTLACNLWKSKAERPQPFFFFYLCLLIPLACYLREH